MKVKRVTIRKYFPRVGTIFRNREELVKKLEKSGWKFEGQETYFHSRTSKVIGYNVGVIDKGMWLIIELDPIPEGVRVTTVKGRGKGWKGITERSLPEYIPILGVDAEIKNLVRDLNEAGYITEYSCAGHGQERGFVSFTKVDFSKDELEDIRNIFRQNGIERITLKVKRDITQATYPSMG